jgi:hypothetical protein
MPTHPYFIWMGLQQAGMCPACCVESMVHHEWMVQIVLQSPKSKHVATNMITSTA